MSVGRELSVVRAEIHALTVAAAVVVVIAREEKTMRVRAIRTETNFVSVKSSPVLRS